MLAGQAKHSFASRLVPPRHSVMLLSALNPQASLRLPGVIETLAPLGLLTTFSTDITTQTVFSLFAVDGVCLPQIDIRRWSVGLLRAGIKIIRQARNLSAKRRNGQNSLSCIDILLNFATVIRHCGHARGLLPMA